MKNLLTKMSEALKLLLQQTRQSQRTTERKLVVEWFGRLHAEISQRNLKIRRWFDSFPASINDNEISLSEFWKQGDELLDESGSSMCARIAFLSAGIEDKLTWLKESEPEVFAKIQALVGIADGFPMRSLALYAEVFGRFSVLRHLREESDFQYVFETMTKLRKEFVEESINYEEGMAKVAEEAGVALLDIAEFEAYQTRIEEIGNRHLVLLGDETHSASKGYSEKGDRPVAFLSYAREDIDAAWQVYEALQMRGVSVWFDKTDLKPGSWKPQIERAIAKSRYFLICVSHSALRKTGDRPGFQDRELQIAFSIALAQPEEVFTVVPIRLEDCGRGDHRLSGYQQFDLFESFEDEITRLVDAIQT